MVINLTHQAHRTIVSALSEMIEKYVINIRDLFALFSENVSDNPWKVINPHERTKCKTSYF